MELGYPNLELPFDLLYIVNMGSAFGFVKSYAGSYAGGHNLVYRRGRNLKG